MMLGNGTDDTLKGVEDVSAAQRNLRESLLKTESENRKENLERLHTLIETTHRAMMAFYKRVEQGLKRDEDESTRRHYWFVDAAKLVVSELFINHEIPAYRVSAGDPGKEKLGRVTQKNVGDPYELTIKPVYGESQVLESLVHEFAHVVAGQAAGHGPEFQAVLAEVGLPNDRPTPEFSEWGGSVIYRLGFCPAINDRITPEEMANAHAESDEPVASETRERHH